MTWTTTTLGELASQAGGVVRTGPFGAQLHKSDYVDDPTATPVVMPKDMVDGRIETASVARVNDEVVARLSSHALHPGDIVLGRRGDIGRRAWTGDTEDGWLCGTGSMRIAVNGSTKIRPRFLFYYLGLPQTIGWLEGHSVGATMSNLSAGVVQQLPVRYPSLALQDAIVEALDSVETLVDNNRQRIEVLKQMCRQLYREWFVRFRFPGHEDIELVNSDLGPIPEGWDIRSFSDIADFVNGFAFKSNHWLDDGLPIVKIKELKGGVASDTPRYHGADIDKKYFINSGAVLFSWSADLEVYVWAFGPALLNQHLFDVRPYDVSHLFVFHSLSERMEEFRARAQGTTMKHIKRSALGEVRLVLPPVGLRNGFERLARPMLDLQLNLVGQIQVLRAAAELLLPRLVSGDLDVSEFGVEVEAVNG